MALVAAGVLLGATAAARAATTSAAIVESACETAPATPLPATCEDAHGVLVIDVRDAAGRATPARVEVLDADGRSWIANDDALLVGGDCRGHASTPSADEIAAAEPLLGLLPFVRNPQTRTYQMYLPAGATLALPPGRYRVAATKGLEFRPAWREVTIHAGDTVAVALDLERWIDMPALGWFSADDHLHLPRRDDADDRRIALWMQAENVNVANLLQMEIVPDVIAAAQDRFGVKNVFQDGDTIVASGQENPRTWILGHGIILGAASYVDFPDDPLDYGRYWSAAARDGAVRGYAHWGTGAARDGLAIDAPAGHVEFVEVLQSDIANHDALHDLLNLGLRIAPTAGTDFPCTITNLPGRDRFYAHVGGKLTYRAWLDAIRAGRTFVTNGPLLTRFAVDDASIGDTLELAAPRTVAVRGEVRFDPARDDVQRVELLVNGDVVHVADPARDGTVELAFDFPADRDAWLALRARGWKRDQPQEARPRAVSLHSGAIYVTVADGPAFDAQDETRRRAAAELQRLTRLEARLQRDARAGVPQWVGATREEVERALPALRAAIAAARARWEAVVRGGAPTPGAAAAAKRVDAGR